MEKHFVDYNQALALKELGFNEICFATFDSDKWFDIQDFGQNYDTFPSHIIAAPLKSQVFEWFREKYNWHNVPLGTVRLSDNKVVYHIGKPNIIYPYGKVYDTYEEAESACIDNLIENAKNK